MIVFPNDWIGRQLKIALVGCGGTGSEMIARLFKMNYLLQMVGGEGFTIDAYDPKHVSEFNVGRQNFWVHDVGLPKAEVLVTRYNNFGDCNWSYSRSAFKVNDLSRYDIVITCVDSASFRTELGEMGADRVAGKTLWLDGGNDDNRGQAVLGDLGDCSNRIPNVYDLFPALKDAKDDTRQSCSHAESITRQDFGINANVAEAMSQMLWQLLRYGKLEHNISFINLKNFEITSIPASPDQWALLGYQPTIGNAS